MTNIPGFPGTHRIWAAALLCLLLLASEACIRPQNYHPARSVFAYESRNDGYFFDERFYEAYVEFDARGNAFTSAQAANAAALIHALRNDASGPEQRVRVFVFVHGWKNNASEDSGNVWGFRRMMNHLAYAIHTTGRDDRTTPVIGVYVGWPGAVTKVGKFFSFWNRESVADAVGAGDLPDVLRTILVAAKGDRFDGISDAVLIGHSFGGLVLERAARRIFNEQITALAPGAATNPAADLVVLLNEAGPASQAAPFIEKLINEHIEFSANGRRYPLIASMTSKGDPATKIAFPGGEFVSPSRPVTIPFPNLDTFGQKTSTPYNLLTAANMIALQSHDVVPLQPAESCPASDIAFPLHDSRDSYCIQRKAASPQVANTTPYWIMQLPQVFVPDHSSVFRDEVITLISALLADRGWISPNAVNSIQLKSAARGILAPPPPPQLAPAPPPAKPMLRKGPSS